MKIKFEKEPGWVTPINALFGELLVLKGRADKVYMCISTFAGPALLDLETEYAGGFPACAHSKIVKGELTIKP